MIVSAENEHQQQLLPYEICIDILSRLPTDSILQCKPVCKAWRSIIEQDHVFHAMYTRRLISSSSASSSSSLDFVYLEHVQDKFLGITYDKLRFIEYNVTADDEPITMYLKRNTVTLPLKQHPKTDDNLRFMIVGSCHGLICLATYSYEDDVHHHIFVSNPLTGENMDLSPTTTELHHCQNSSLYLIRTGFGYLPSTNEYKVVRIYTHNTWERRIAYVQVYTIGSGTGIRWRTIPRTSWWCNMVFENRASARAGARGVSVNGVIYFNDYAKIISFDLANEEFRIIVPQPTCITKFEQLGVLGGCLCGTSRSPIAAAKFYSETLDLWVLEEKNDTWIKTYSIQCGKLHSMPLGNALFPPNSMILLMQPERENKIDSYNAETGLIMNTRNIPGDPGHFYRGNYLGGLEIIPYVKSCVSLKALGEKYAKRSWSSKTESSRRKIYKERKLEKRGRIEAGCSAKGAFKKRKGKPTF